jgi:hypothetical protein
MDAGDNARELGLIAHEAIIALILPERRNPGAGRPERPPQAESLPHFESSRAAKKSGCSSASTL